MKKDVTEKRTFCDFCEKEEPAYVQCLVCKQDLCEKHDLALEVSIGHQQPGFRAHLCPIDAQPLKSFLKQLKIIPGDSRQIGQNPEYNAARLEDVLHFIAGGMALEDASLKK